jgi:hypothetical protein
MTEPTHATEAATEAMDWLAGRMRWERILRDLHDRAEGDAPVATIGELAANQDDAAA